MRALLLASILLTVACSTGPQAPVPPEPVTTGSEASVALPETVELALVLAALSPLGRDTGGTIHREGPYFEAVEAHFAPFSEMEAVVALGAQFNLPRLAGNAADFAFDDAGRLVEVDTSGSLWGDAENDLFRRHRDAIQAFADASDFRGFYADQQAAYERLLDATRAMGDPDDMRAWLEEQFAVRPGPTRIIVSPLMSGFHWTTLYKPELRIWTNAPDPERVAGATSLERMQFARRVFTELDHSYVNPVSARFRDEIEGALARTAVWTTERAARNYPTAELQFNEYMTFAVFLMYATDRLPEDALTPLVDDVNRMMARNRGFLAFEPFAAEALARYREGGVTAEELVPDMISWCATFDRSRETTDPS